MCFTVPILSTPYIESSVSVITWNSSTWHNHWPGWHTAWKWFSFPHLWHTLQYAGHLPFPWWPPQCLHWFCLAPFFFVYCLYCLGLCFLCFWVSLGLVFALFFTALTVFRFIAYFPKLFLCGFTYPQCLNDPLQTTFFLPKQSCSSRFVSAPQHQSVANHFLMQCVKLTCLCQAPQSNQILVNSFIWLLSSALWNKYLLYSMFLQGAKRGSSLSITAFVSFRSLSISSNLHVFKICSWTFFAHYAFYHCDLNSCILLLQLCCRCVILKCVAKILSIIGDFTSAAHRLWRRYLMWPFLCLSFSVKPLLTTPRQHVLRTRGLTLPA